MANTPGFLPRQHAPCPTVSSSSFALRTPPDFPRSAKLDGRATIREDSTIRDREEKKARAQRTKARAHSRLLRPHVQAAALKWPRASPGQHHHPTAILRHDPRLTYGTNRPVKRPRTHASVTRSVNLAPGPTGSPSPQLPRTCWQ